MLSQIVPTAPSRKLSKLETLREAVRYIRQLQNVLQESDSGPASPDFDYYQPPLHQESQQPSTYVPSSSNQLPPLNESILLNYQRSNYDQTSTMNYWDQNDNGQLVSPPASDTIEQVEVVERRNERERKRVHQVNQGYELLSRKVPYSKSKSKKLTKVETLRYAVQYIRHLERLLRDSENTSSYPSTNENSPTTKNTLKEITSSSPITDPYWRSLTLNLSNHNMFDSPYPYHTSAPLYPPCFSFRQIND
ncbi:unnamed protein product [Anisakis simplex]|uniref:BHLH domain-containing protein n=1 Tax=Anisakis simplex TaxID=6269 RepID=A0A3P6N717_ANISI|nr:unnamed protein product [Anisakis simplex]